MKTTRAGAAIFELRANRLRLMRALRDLHGGPRRFRASGASLEPANAGDTIARSVTSLRAELDDDPALTDGKIENLRVAVRRLDGLVVPAGATFGLWRQLGKPSGARGFVRGRELREGCLVPTVGGGLCQLSNALYACALDAGFEILERHAHSQRVPGSQAAIGRDATLFWNYLDLRFRAQREFVIEARLGRDDLTIAFRETRSRATLAAPRPVTKPSHTSNVIDVTDRLVPSVGTCTTCDAAACARHEPHADDARPAPAGPRTAFLLDGVSPEFDAYVREQAQPGDLARIPVDGARFRLARYAWTTSPFARVDEYRLTALRRTIRSRVDGASPFGRSPAAGGARQRVALEEAEHLARAYARRLPSDVRHVVVAQSLLPFVWLEGVLGGRTFDVLTTLPTMAEIHSVLDAGAAAHPSSRTFADFRAPRHLVEAERAAFAAARRIVTPNATLAAAAGSRAVRLPWHVPATATSVRPHGSRTAIVFAGATLARAGAYEVRAAARRLGLPLVLTSETDLEDDNFWSGVEVARVPFGDALARAAVLISPAYVTSQPRRELRALASGVPAIVTDACGLGDGAGVTTVPIGDADALAGAIDRAMRSVATRRTSHLPNGTA